MPSVEGGKSILQKLTIALVSFILVGAQFIASSESNLAYATPYWDSEGTLLVHGKVHVSNLEQAKVAHPRTAIPLYKPHMGSETGTPSSQTLATTSTTQNVVQTGAINGLGYDGVTPPDVQVAAGPVNITEMVNLQGEIWHKNGVVESGPFELSSFFITGSDFISDPKVLYDSISGKWFASLTDVTASSVRVAVSTTNDATQGFCVYNIPVSSYLLLDQPILGVSHDKVVVSTNDFNKFSGTFKYAQFWVLNKSQMLSCSPTNYVTKTTSSYFSIHPVQSLTDTTTQYMASTLHTSTGSFVYLFSVIGVPGNTAVSVSIRSFQVSSILNPPNAVQSGTSYALNTGDYRVQDAVWANNLLWLVHNNKCTPSGDTSSRSCLHLVELNTSTMKVYQDFNYGVSGKYVFYPALRDIPSSNNLLLVFGFSSSTDYPGIEVTEQAATDLANSLETPTLLQAGKGPVTLTYGCSSGVCRYGDYFGAGLDPSISNNVWVAGEYGTGTVDSIYGNEWATQIGNFTG